MSGAGKIWEDGEHETFGAAIAKETIAKVQADYLGRPGHRQWSSNATASWSGKRNEVKEGKKENGHQEEFKSDEASMSEEALKEEEAPEAQRSRRSSKSAQPNRESGGKFVQTTVTRKRTWGVGYRVAQMGFAGAAGLALKDKNYYAAGSFLGGFLMAEVLHDALDGTHEESYPIRVRHEISDRSALYMGAGIAGAGDSLGMGMAFAGSSSPTTEPGKEGSFAWGVSQAKPFHISVLSPLVGVSR